VEIGRITVRSHSGKKLSTNKPGLVVHTYNPNYMGGIGRTISVQASPEKKHEALAKRAGGVAQVVKHLPSKCKVLSTAKK
jgi:hypothetical protein